MLTCPLDLHTAPDIGEVSGEAEQGLKTGSVTTKDSPGVDTYLQTSQSDPLKAPRSKVFDVNDMRLARHSSTRHKLTVR